jgi:VanZ family protein
MLYFTSTPAPYALVGGRGTTVTDVLGHFLGFGVLGALMLRWWTFRTGELTPLRLLQALALCLAYALLDELHQIPIPGRSFEWLDLLVDATGIVLGTGAALLYRARR